MKKVETNNCYNEFVSVSTTGKGEWQMQRLSDTHTKVTKTAPGLARGNTGRTRKSRPRAEQVGSQQESAPCLILLRTDIPTVDWTQSSFDPLHVCQIYVRRAGAHYTKQHSCVPSRFTQVLMHTDKANLDYQFYSRPKPRIILIFNYFKTVASVNLSIQ